VKGRRQRIRRVSEDAIQWARGYRGDRFRGSSLWLRQERGLHGGYRRGDNATGRHGQRIDYPRWSDGRRHSEQDNDFEAGHEEHDQKKGANKDYILDPPLPSAVPDKLLAVPPRSLARAGFLECGRGLVSILRPHGGYMRRTVRNAATLASAVMVLLFAVSCDDDILGLDDPDYNATLIPGNEPAPASSGTGSGTATFEDNGAQIEYSISVTGLTAVNGAHIHLGAAGVNGPIIINLFNPVTAGGAANGVIATGTITNVTNANVSLDSLRVLFNNGNAYVNVHTDQFPGGAIRDQVRPDN